jgi:hypothetical protein
VSVVDKGSWNLEGEKTPPKTCKADPMARIEPPELTASFDFYGLGLENSK